jgi:hypothetical protein
VALLLGLMGGPLGLLAIAAAGAGKTGRVGSIGAVISMLGLVFYFIGVLYTGLVDPEMGIFTLAARCSPASACCRWEAPSLRRGGFAAGGASLRCWSECTTRS